MIKHVEIECLYKRSLMQGKPVVLLVRTNCKHADQSSAIRIKLYEYYASGADTCTIEEE